MASQNGNGKNSGGNGTAAVATRQPKITTQILAEIQRQQHNGRLDLPPNYSAANALNSAYLILRDTKTTNEQPVLKACTPDSIVRTLLKMVYLGLNPAKTQCYFIPYGNELSLHVSYFGNMKIAYQVCPEIEEITATVIYEGDRVKTKMDRGRKVVVSHEQDFGNMDPTKIRGAYANIIYKDGHWTSEVMTIEQIKKCWEMGKTKGHSKAHAQTPEEMCKRTVINRALKPIIDTADDTSLFGQTVRAIEQEESRAERDAQIRERTNAIAIDAEIVEEPERVAERIEASKTNTVPARQKLTPEIDADYQETAEEEDDPRDPGEPAEIAVDMETGEVLGIEAVEAEPEDDGDVPF